MAANVRTARLGTASRRARRVCWIVFCTALLAFVLAPMRPLASDDLPALPLVALNTTIVSNVRVRDLYNSVDLTAGDFSDAWLGE